MCVSSAARLGPTQIPMNAVAIALIYVFLNIGFIIIWPAGDWCACTHAHDRTHVRV
jgi:hypothetical protein